MKKALVTITKRIVLDDSNTNEKLLDILNAAHSEVSSECRIYNITNYLLTEENRSNQFKRQIDNAAKLRTMPLIYQMRSVLPGIYDDSGRMSIKETTVGGIVADYDIEVISFVSGEIDKFRIAIYFTTTQLVLLRSFGEKLLLAFPNETGEDDGQQTYFENTFFLTLTNDIYFSDYKEL